MKSEPISNSSNHSKRRQFNRKQFRGKLEIEWELPPCWRERSWTLAQVDYLST